jgi:hypothetical protein
MAIPLSPELKHWMTGIYMSALRQFGVFVPAEQILLQPDCSCVVMSKVVDEDLHQFLASQDDLTVISYKPGEVTFIDIGLKEFHDKVGPMLRRQLRDAE